MGKTYTLEDNDGLMAELKSFLESQKKVIKRISADRDIEHDARIKAEEEKDTLYS